MATNDTEYAAALRAAEEAAEWLERLKTAGPRERDLYLEWLRESSLHVREMLLATAWDSVLNDLEKGRPHPQPTDTSKPLEHNQPRTPTRFERRTLRWAVALGSAYALAVAGVALNARIDASPTYETQLGQQDRISLPDGSVAQLNTLTTLRADYSQQARTLHLARGQATFDVRHERTRPFVVEAGDAVIQALGTKFDVRVDGNTLTVAVVEGRVAIRNAHLREELLAGESLRIDQQLPPARTRIERSDVLAWQQRRLVFHERPLREIAEEFNRYNRLQLLIRDPELADRTYSGVFNADDPMSLAAYLSQDATIAVRRTDRMLIVQRIKKP